METPAALNLKYVHFKAVVLLSYPYFHFPFLLANLVERALPWLSSSTPTQTMLVVIWGVGDSNLICYTKYAFTGALQFTKPSPLPNYIHI